jgi:hypothetical protein
MTAPDERVWLTHPAHGGHFHCPADAVEEWTGPDMGWVLAEEPPPEDNPVVAEALAQRKALAEQAAAEEKAARKSSRKSGADTTPQEG